MMDSLGSLIALLSAAFFGGIVSGLSGFAFSAVAGAILLHVFEPTLAVPLMMICSIASQITSLGLLRRLVAWREVTPMLIGGAVAIPVAIALFAALDARHFRTAFGIFLVSYAGIMLLRPRRGESAFPNGPMAHSAVGFAGGLVGGLTAMPGAVPAIWCDLRGMPKERQRGVVQPFILAMQILAVVTLVSQVDMSHQRLAWHAALAAPALAGGTLLGVRLFGKVDEKRFRLIVLSLLLVSGGLMIR